MASKNNTVSISYYDIIQNLISNCACKTIQYTDDNNNNIMSPPPILYQGFDIYQQYNTISFNETYIKSEPDIFTQKGSDFYHYKYGKGTQNGDNTYTFTKYGYSLLDIDITDNLDFERIIEVRDTLYISDATVVCDNKKIKVDGTDEEKPTYSSFNFTIYFKLMPQFLLKTNTNIEKINNRLDYKIQNAYKKLFNSLDSFHKKINYKDQFAFINYNCKKFDINIEENNTIKLNLTDTIFDFIYNADNIPIIHRKDGACLYSKSDEFFKDKINLFFDSLNLVPKMEHMLNDFKKKKSISDTSLTKEIDDLIKLCQITNINTPKYYTYLITKILCYIKILLKLTNEKFDNYIFFIPNTILKEHFTLYTTTIDENIKKDWLYIYEINNLLEGIEQKIYFITLPSVENQSYNEMDDYLLIMYLLRYRGMYYSYDDYNWFNGSIINNNNNYIYIHYDLLNILRVNHSLYNDPDLTIPEQDRRDHYDLNKLYHPKKYFEFLNYLNTNWIDIIKKYINPEINENDVSIYKYENTMYYNYIKNVNIFLTKYFIYIAQQNQKPFETNLTEYIIFEIINTPTNNKECIENTLNNELSIYKEILTDHLLDIEGLSTVDKLFKDIPDFLDNGLQAVKNNSNTDYKFLIHSSPHQKGGGNKPKTHKKINKKNKLTHLKTNNNF